MESDEIIWSMPDDMRDRLKDLLGPIVVDDRLKEAVAGRPVTVVGDIAAASVIRADLNPMLAIVDFRTKRGPILDGSAEAEAVRGYGDKVVVVRNPAATLTRALWNAIGRAYEQALDGIITRIEVDGEEDLASLPCLLMAPEGTVVIYGIPDRGMTVVATGKDIKELVVRVLQGCKAL